MQSAIGNQLTRFIDRTMVWPQDNWVFRSQWMDGRQLLPGPWIWHHYSSKWCRASDDCIHDAWAAEHRWRCKLCKYTLSDPESVIVLMLVLVVIHTTSKARVSIANVRLTATGFDGKEIRHLRKQVCETEIPWRWWFLTPPTIRGKTAMASRLVFCSDQHLRSLILRCCLLNKEYPIDRIPMPFSTCIKV